MHDRKRDIQAAGRGEDRIGSGSNVWPWRQALSHPRLSAARSAARSLGCATSTATRHLAIGTECRMGKGNVDGTGFANECLTRTQRSHGVQAKRY